MHDLALGAKLKAEQSITLTWIWLEVNISDSIRHSGDNQARTCVRRLCVNGQNVWGAIEKIWLWDPSSARHFHPRLPIIASPLRSLSLSVTRERSPTPDAHLFYSVSVCQSPLIPLSNLLLHLTCSRMLCGSTTVHLHIEWCPFLIQNIRKPGHVGMNRGGP